MYIYISLGKLVSDPNFGNLLPKQWGNFFSLFYFGMHGGNKENRSPYANYPNPHSKANPNGFDEQGNTKRFS
ncbi:hypothetical protein E2542_SST17467 [Spatholobus suberectus]|nr:hypothetical protein E2542_SST17467 [Spatholobus suberectus]